MPSTASSIQANSTSLPGPRGGRLKKSSEIQSASDAQWQLDTQFADSQQTPDASADSPKRIRRLDAAGTPSLVPAGLSWVAAVGLTEPQLEAEPVYLVHPNYKLDEQLETNARERVERRIATQRPAEPDQLQEQYRRLISEAAHDVRSPIATASQLISTVAQRVRGLGNVTKAELSLLEIANQRLAQASNWAAGILVDRRLEQLSAISIKKRFYPQQWQALMQPLLNSIAKDHNVRLIWIGWERSLPRLYLDVNQLSRVILNLVTNAIQASPVGGQITLRIGRPASNNSRITIQVEDQGDGLSDELMQLVNSQGTSYSETPTRPSTGIGLSTCRSLVTSLGGSLSACRLESQGTQLTVSVPVDDLKLSLRSWLLRQHGMQSTSPEGLASSVFGVRIGHQVTAQQIDQKLQLLSSNYELVHRIGSDRWLCFSSQRDKTAAKLTTLVGEYSECYVGQPFRFLEITKTRSSRDDGAKDTIALAADNLFAHATRALGNTIPLLDNLDADFGHIYNESLLRNRMHPSTHRRHDTPERNQLHRHQSAYERNPSPSPPLNQSLTQELTDLAHGWRRTQERLDQAHHH